MTRSFVKECLICSRKGEEFVFNRNVETGEIKAYLNRYAVVPLETLDTMTNPYKNYIVISFGRLRLKIGRWYIVFSNHRCINFLDVFIKPAKISVSILSILLVVILLTPSATYIDTITSKQETK